MLFPLYDLNPHRRIPFLTVWIIIANAAITLWTTSLDQPRFNEIAHRYGFVPKRVTELRNGQPIVVRVPQLDRHGQAIPHAPMQQIQLPADPNEVYATFLTTMFLHGGWLHLVLNMWMLWIFGNNIEDRLGHLMFVCYYLLGGLVATLCHWAVDPQSAMPVVGASGAVAAVLGGYAITYPQAKVRTLVFVGFPLIFDLPALVVLGFWFLAQMASGLIMLRHGVHEPVAFWAHVGGFVAGVVLMPFLALGASPPEADWKKEADELFRFEDPRLAQDAARSKRAQSEPGRDD